MLEKFDFYLEKRKVVKQNISTETVRSLMQKAKKRENYILSQTITEANSDFLFEDIYESIREAAQSLLAKEGYKSYSHEAVIAFIKENYKEFSSEEVEKFDEYRKIRNSLVYYAKSTTIEKTRQALEYMQSFIRKIESISKGEHIGANNSAKEVGP